MEVTLKGCSKKKKKYVNNTNIKNTLPNIITCPSLLSQPFGLPRSYEGGVGVRIHISILKKMFFIASRRLVRK